MLVPNYLGKTCILLTCLMPFVSSAQSISAEEKTTAIQEIAKNIAAHYVYPEQGGQIASHIQIANQRGDFQAAQNWETFDELVTGSIRDFSKDPHLYIHYNPEKAAQLKSGSLKNANRMYVAEGQGEQKNSGLSESRVLDGNVGYLKFGSLNINQSTLQEIKDAMLSVADTRALIIDMRDNGGGGSEEGAVLESFFFPAEKSLLDFSARNGEVRSLKTVNWLDQSRYEKPVYIIVNKKTASAAEAFAFTMQQYRRARVVGETSAGAAYMNEWFPIGEHSYLSVSTSAPHLPGTDRNWQGVGVKPDIKVKNSDPVAEIISHLAKGK